jgi:3',5'-cyclic AMP phosphodiesterase CpdA
MGPGRYTRREVLGMGAAAVVAPVLPAPELTRFGVIADVHHGLALDTEARLEAFLTACEGRKLDFIVQLGDFNHPVRAARGFLNAWMGYRGPRYGVLGNHDMDLGSKEHAVDMWRVPGRYYSFDAGSHHFVVLDANNIYQDRKFAHYADGNYFQAIGVDSFCDDEQLDWLAADLAATVRQTVVFVHQPIDETYHGGTCRNRNRVRAVLEEANRRAGFTKIAAVFQGHHHDDGYEERRGIHYFRVNSASYLWVGGEFGRMAHYDRSLFGFVTIGGGEIELEGTSGQWVAPSPAERGVPDAAHFVPSVLDRRVRVATASTL